MAIEIAKKVVLLATGGTIAGLAAKGSDNIGYTAAQLGVADLLAALPSELQSELEVLPEQVAQIDSKDMDCAVWRLLAQRCIVALAQPDVSGVVITHGTDTMEETAYFLHAALSRAGCPAKPVVLTGAMRPASSLAPDGPQNVRDALAVVCTPGATGVMVVFAGRVHHALHVQKVHTYRLDAFDSGDAGPLAYVEEGAMRWAQATVPGPWPADGADAGAGVAGGMTVAAAAVIPALPWPRVEIVLSHAGAGAAIVDSLLSTGSSAGDPLRGIVVAGTGNGSVHRDLEAALLRAVARGVRVVRASRCALGRVLPSAGAALPDSGGLSAPKARVTLMLALLHEDHAARAPRIAG